MIMDETTPTAPTSLRWYIPNTAQTYWVEYQPDTGAVYLGHSAEAVDELGQEGLAAITEAYRSAQVIAADRRLWKLAE